ncbi:MAG: hypothetical protein L0226_05530 [Acidobacteria bacterium]|nr:hypothetical protein [Acidobacteriota bacterium]
MGNFIVIVAPSEAKDECERLFQVGLANVERIKGRMPHGLVRRDWVRAASFARRNGSGSPIAEDPETSSWLLAAGTWFHPDSFASGDELRLLARIISVGPELIARELEGFFVIVYGDARAQEVIVITDVIGSRHCFFRRIDRCSALSTSSLVLAALAECSLDVVGCEEFLRTGVVYENRTFFQEVRKIAPARVARFTGGRPVTESRYWNIQELDPDKLDGPHAVIELSENLVGVARRVANVFPRPVCDLTGGYDSRAIVAAFLTAGVDFETTVAGSADSADCLVSNGLSKLTGIPHWHLENETRLSHRQLEEALRLTDGGYDVVDYARIFSLHRQLSSRFEVSINGSFGELARGYWWELLWPHIGKREALDKRKIAVRRYVVDPSSPQLYPLNQANITDKDAGFIEHFAQVIERANAGLAGWPNTAQMDNTYLELRMQYWQGRIASSTDQIWPCLSPFMFRSVLETMLQIKARWRYRSLLIRMMLAELQPELAAYPLEHGYPPTPLTWRNWPRFLPALKALARKAESRLLNGRRGAVGASGVEPLRLQLWREPEVCELLEPEKMRLNELLEISRLRGFLDSSRAPHFQFDHQWNRVLSLEMALKILRSS